MVTAQDSRRIALTLPRTEETLIRDRIKFKVGRIVYTGISPDETSMGLAFPKEERAALVSSNSEKFRMPIPSDLRYNWVRTLLARLDPNEMHELSQTALPDLLSQLTPLNRAMVWCTLLMSVQDGAFAATAYLDLVTRMVATEPQLSILTEVLEHAKKDVLDRFLDPTGRAAAVAALAAACRARLFDLSEDDERRTGLLRALIELTTDLRVLRDWLAGACLLAGYALDAYLSWRVRYRLAVLGDLSEHEITAALDADPTTRGEQYARCRPAWPDRAAAWRAITTDPDLSNYRLWAMTDGFWQPERVELTAPCAEEFFTAMPATARLRGDMALDHLMRFLYPHHAWTEDTPHHAEKLLASDDITVQLRRKVAGAIDDLRRIVAVRTAGQ